MARRKNSLAIGSDPQWYKDAIVYEVHVRAFLDSNADGIGDFPGLTRKLDYLRDLGVTAIWLLPFYPSPLKDDGYDIADYYTINPMYGTLKDFKAFLDGAHSRNLRVITELVVNHTSDLHPWFQRSRRAPPGSKWRDYYVWSDSPDKYKEARIIFRDFEPSNWTWDRVAHSYFWHRFYSHQPDLNYDNPAVHKEILKVLDFWLDMGVDGLRLDAVPYLYEREGTSCENLPETHEFLKKLRSHVDRKYGDRLLLAEANQWPEDSVAYFGSGKGDECHMAFHFPLMPRIFMSVRMEDRVPIVDILEQTPAIPETSQWALFLRNHDELTLEMVTDEERDYMYRVYANDAKARINLGIRRRLAPLLGNNRRRIELLNLLLFSYPGTPFVYYGDEIGLGDNVYLGDRNGVRTPMQWNSDRNAGFSRAHPHALYLPIILDPEYHYEAVNVEAQQANPHSLWWWMKRVLTLRKRYKAFGRGTIQFLAPENRKILAFVRKYEEETILVVANLSRFAQAVALDLSEFRDRIPMELFGRSEFPKISASPYPLSLSGHAAFWFSLEPAVRRVSAESCNVDNTMFRARDDWREIVRGPGAAQMEACLTSWIRQRRWFAGKGHEIRAVQVKDSVPIDTETGEALVLIVLVEFVDADPQEYLLPVGFATGLYAEQKRNEQPHLLIARIHFETTPSDDGLVYDASGDKAFGRAVLEALLRKRSFDGNEGHLRAASTHTLRNDPAFQGKQVPEPCSGRAEQSNTSVVFADRYFLKFYRKLEPGINPDLEIGKYLTAQSFPNSPHVAGWLQYSRGETEQLTLGILTTFVPRAKDAWEFTLDSLGRYFERVRTLPAEAMPDRNVSPDLLTLAESELSQSALAVLGTYVEAARLMGQRTAELHLALGRATDEKDFTPEPFTPFYQRGLFQSMRNLATRNLRALRGTLVRLPEPTRALAEKVLAAEPEILQRFKSLHQAPLHAKRIRCHGDYHLGQVLYTGKDFIIIDFEGEPARSLGERRIKRTPLRDVAGMIRSFDYVTYAGLAAQFERGSHQEDQSAALEPWARYWYASMSAVFLKSYLKHLATADLLPKQTGDLRLLLEASLLEKAIYEVGYEIHNRPEWVRIPLQGILQLTAHSRL